MGRPPNFQCVAIVVSSYQYRAIVAIEYAKPTFPSGVGVVIRLYAMGFPKRQGVRRGFRPNDPTGEVDCSGTKPPGKQGISYRSDGEWRLGCGRRQGPGPGQGETHDLSAVRIDPD